MRSNVTAIIVALAVAWTCSGRAAWAQGAQGIRLFEEHCATCHLATPNPDNRTPGRDALRQRSPEAILDTLTSGSMALNAQRLTADQKRLVAEFLSGRPIGASASGAAAAMPNRCPETAFADPMTAAWNGWGVDLGNSRYQPASVAGIAAEQVPKLTLKWAFGFPDASSAYGQPTIAGGRLYVGADTGFVYALDARTGCVYWSFQA